MCLSPESFRIFAFAILDISIVGERRLVTCSREDTRLFLWRVIATCNGVCNGVWLDIWVFEGGVIQWLVNQEFIFLEDITM